MGSGKEANISTLLVELKQGSETAFNELYYMHSKMLLSNIRHLVKDSEVAKELLQDLYMKVWESRENIDIERSYKSFVFTIAKNMVLNYLRRVALDKKARIVLIQNIVEFYSHTEEELNLKETNEIVMQAVETLPHQCRQVFILSKLEGKSHQYISDELGISMSTIANHMVKANKEVRAYLLSHGDQAIVLFVTILLHNLKN